MADELPKVELIESFGEWKLRISGPPDLIERLVSGADDVEVTVSIRPNLVPGDDFTAVAALER